MCYTNFELKRRIQMISLLSSATESIKAFLVDITSALGLWGTLGVVCGVEALFIIFFAIKSAFSYEARLRKCLDKLNTWLFKTKTINEGNIKRFNALVKTGPKRLVYYWQQFILYREGGPKEYLTEENLIKKPLQTSSWANNVKNLSILTYSWAFFSAIVGLAVQATTSTLTVQTVAFSLLFPAIVLLLGVVSVLVIRGTRAANLDEIYHLHHLFIRFVQNACAELPPYIDFNLLFTPKEIEKGNAHLREYYEERARQAKKEFDEARVSDASYVEYNFEDVGVDGTLLLNRAMRESEKFINKKTKILSQIAQIETQKDTLKRNYENVQIDLQRKIQVSKENIKSLIDKQAATTSRVEAQLLKSQQDKEIAKQTELQKDYDQEESRYNSSKAEFDEEIIRLNKELDTSMNDATTGMSSEYQFFFEKVMKNAYDFSDKKVEGEKNALREDRDRCEDELFAVQTQVKHLLDENNILRHKLEGYDPKFKQRLKGKEGKYVNGVFVDKNGGYHDENGYFHAKDGKVYNSLGELVSHDETDDERIARETQELKEEQVNKFGAFVDNSQKPSPEVAPIEQEPEIQQQEVQVAEPVQEVEQINEPIVEEIQEQIVEEIPQNQENNEIVEEIQEPSQEQIPEIQEEIPQPIPEIQEEQIPEIPQEEVTVTQEPIQEAIPEEAMVESVDFDELFGGGMTEPATNEEVYEEVQPVQEEPKSEEFKFEEPVSEQPQNVTTQDDFGFNDLFAEQQAQEEIKPAYTPIIKQESAPSHAYVSQPTYVIHPTYQAQEVPTIQSYVQPVQTEPAKKRGRPRKEDVKVQPVQEEPAKKRGRPRKDTQVASTVAPVQEAPAKKRGRPRKDTTSTTPASTKTSGLQNAQPVQTEPAKKRGRPRKEKDDASAIEIDTLARINQLIHEEEAKLKNMKSIINDQLDEAIEKAAQSKIEQERAEILSQVEELQAQAIDAQHQGKVAEFSSLNSKIETLITRLAELNKR